MRVFLDANVLFSAAYRETGSVRVFFPLAQAGACTLVTSAYALDEARRNIRAKHPERIADLELLATKLAVCGEPTARTLAGIATLGLPMKDKPILAATIDAKCHLLVTGDRTHFGKLFGKRIHGTVVVPPIDAIEILVGED
jgi:predicted nucleic acid-binding protein